MHAEIDVTFEETGELTELLGSQLDQWDYPIFRAEELMRGTVLSRTAMSIFRVIFAEYFLST